MRAGMSDVLWNGWEIRDPWSSFELSWSPTGCHNDKGKVISWGIGRPLDKFLFSLAKEISLFISSTSSNKSEDCAPLHRWWFLLLTGMTAGCCFLRGVGCQEVKDRQDSAWQQSNRHGSVCLYCSRWKGYWKGESKKIRLWDSGSFWMRRCCSRLWVCSMGLICYCVRVKIVHIRPC